MQNEFILRIADMPPLQRGDGVIISPLITPDSLKGAAYRSGLTKFSAGCAAPMHSHNCDEQATIIEGSAECVVGDRRERVGPMDTNYIAANESHCFDNVGEGMPTILRIYASGHITRTFTKSGMTVNHLPQGGKVN